MRRNFNISEVKDIWCGYKLNEKQKLKITELALKEFEKPVHERRSAYMLYREVKGYL